MMKTIKLPLLLLATLCLLLPTQSMSWMNVVTVGGGTPPSGGGIAQVDTTQTWTEQTANVGGQTITIPTGATLAVITAGGVVPFTVSTYFSAGAVTLDSQSATIHENYANDAQQSVAIWTVSGFSTGASKSLAWDWGGGDDGSLNISVTFFSGVDTTGPVRDSGIESVTDDGSPDAGTLTGVSGDFVVGITNHYGTGSTAAWTGATEDTLWGSASSNGNGKSSLGINDSVSGNTAVSVVCSDCSNYAALAAIMLIPE